MRRSFVKIVSGMLLAVAGCGGGGAGAGEPLVSSTLSGTFKGQAFTPAFGVATVYNGSNMIALGDGPINCGSAQRNDPPTGTSAVFSVSTLAVGTYSSIFVDMIQYRAANLDGAGSNSGTVTLTAVSASSVAGSIDYSYIDSTTNDTYGISGSFEVTRCPM
jgi:hypothetical protein